MSSQQPPPRPPHHQPQPRRTNTHKDLGRAPSTVKGDSVSVRFYNAYRAVRGRTSQVGIRYLAKFLLCTVKLNLY